MPGRDVSVVLNGTTHALRFRLSAWRAAERQGYKLEQLFAGLREPSMDAVAVCLWAMLQEETPAPTIDQVSSWVDGGNFAAVLRALGDAIGDAFPERPPSPPAAAPPTP